MKKIISFVLGGVVAVAVGGQVYAAEVAGSGILGSSLGEGTGTNVQADVNGSMNVGITGNASNTGMMANGSSSLGLQAELEGMSGTMNTSSENSIVNLEGNTAASIETNADLTAYNNLVVQSRPAITAINVGTDNSVAIHYSQPAKFLGIFPTTLSGQVNVDAQGNATVHLPWWSFLYSKDTAGVQSAVATASQSSNTNGTAGANTMTSLQAQASMINAVTAAIQSEIQN